MRVRTMWMIGGATLFGAAVLVGACNSTNPGELGNTGGNDASVDLCATPHTGCACSTAGSTAACGYVVNRDGNYVTCSEGNMTCQGGAWGPCIGTHNVFKSVGSLGGDGKGGGIHLLDLGDSGACTGDPCDPQCNGFTGDNSNNVDAAGLLGIDGGWTLASLCQGLQCAVPNCATTLTGVVYDPAALNPVYNALVMIPNGPVPPIPAGVSANKCGAGSLPPPVTYTFSAIDGTFTLSGIPIGASVPLLIQVGQWRRLLTIDTSGLTCGGSINLSAANCAGNGNYAGSAACQTRLPRVQSEGNIPQIAVATGSQDPMECMLYGMGVDVSEFTDELNPGRVHIYTDGGSTLSAYANHNVSYLLGFACDNANCQTPTVSAANITNNSFETGDLTGWTTMTGVASATTAAWYDPTWSAMVGDTSTTIQTSRLSQTFTAPTDATQLSFYAAPMCSNAADEFRAHLIDNTSGFTQVWAGTCTSGAWYEYDIEDLVGGHSYTLVLVNQAASGVVPMYTYVDFVNWGITPNLLPNYDLTIFPCSGAGEYNSANWGFSVDDPGRLNLVNYANVGGRIFGSHYAREWIERPSPASAPLLPSGPFPGVANWAAGTYGAVDPNTGYFDTSFARGQNLANWMGVVTGNSASLQVTPTRYDVQSVIPPTAQFIYDWSDNNPPLHPNAPDNVFAMTFDTPLGGAAAGRVIYTDMHLASGVGSGTFPANCPAQGTALTTQEDAAEYLLFDLGACTIVVPPSTYAPATFTRDFPSACPTGTKAVWRFFYWEDATPGDSNIVFGAYTADTQAQLGTQFPQVPLATVSGPDNCPNGPSCASNFVGVDVDPTLVAAGQASHDWLRISMTLNPSSNMLLPPSLYAWQQMYDCVPSE